MSTERALELCDELADDIHPTNEFVYPLHNGQVTDFLPTPGAPAVFWGEWLTMTEHVFDDTYDSLKRALPEWRRLLIESRSGGLRTAHLDCRRWLLLVRVQWREVIVVAEGGGFEQQFRVAAQVLDRRFALWAHWLATLDHCIGRHRAAVHRA